MNRPILTLRKAQQASIDEVPYRLRFVERNKRYILQELIDDISASLSSSVRWRDVPLVRNP